MTSAPTQLSIVLPTQFYEHEYYHYYDTNTHTVNTVDTRTIARTSKASSSSMEGCHHPLSVALLERDGLDAMDLSQTWVMLDLQVYAHRDASYNVPMLSGLEPDSKQQSKEKVSKAHECVQTCTGSK
eukprot:m.281796 g.281796  ORF g.281796 m.281796 type:complete len:127 (+) comp15754_c0_seq6:2963-3343(+)